MLRALIVSALLVLVFPPGTTADVVKSGDCADYDAWEWAQSIYDWQPSIRNGLDPDGNGLACDHLPSGGFAPSWWTDEIPATAKEAQLVSIIDGDTFIVTVDGVEDEVRLYRSDAPEWDGCGGQVATEFVQQALAYNDNDLTIWLESDVTERDRYDRRLAYLWWEIDGHTYLLNEVLIRSGWAADIDYGDRLYSNELALADQFAQKWQIGQYALCGGFAGEGVSGTTGNLGEFDQQGPGAGQCDPSYPDVCIPAIEVTGDLDCGHIEYRRFTVVPPDPHQFDGNHDGVGCESG